MFLIINKLKILINNFKNCSPSKKCKTLEHIIKSKLLSDIEDEKVAVIEDNASRTNIHL